jgi:hypothetical protein
MCLLRYRDLCLVHSSSPRHLRLVLREHSGNIQGNIQGTFREHSGNMRGRFREHSEESSPELCERQQREQKAQPGRLLLPARPAPPPPPRPDCVPSPLVQIHTPVTLHPESVNSSSQNQPKECEFAVSKSTPL